MAYEQMTPQERMQRAALLRAQREARLGYTPTVTEDLSRYLMSPTEQSVGSVAPVSAQRDDDTDALEAIGKGVATGLDLGANVGIGALKSLEGIFDIGASLVGTVGGLFSEDFKREVEKVVEYQAINEWVENPLDELGLKHSYLNDSEIGEIIGGVAQGVGGMLPAVLVTAATGGTAAPVAVKQALSLGTMIAGVAGNASEEALNDGADLGAATSYGLVSGAIEGATEKLTGGASKWLIGKGLIKGAGNVAAQGGKRILKNMAGEAVEEGLATLVNPLAKTTYKGADALSEYGEAEFYGDVLRDAASGALVAGAFEQTAGRVAHRAGADADIYDAQEAIDNIVNKQRAEQAKGIHENSQLDADAMANLENISATLKKASPEKRAKLIERHDLSQAFTESGDIKPEFAARFDGGTTTPQDGTMGATQSGRGYNKAYYSASLRGSEAKIASEVESIQESRRNVERKRLEKLKLDPSAADNITIKVFDGELSEQGKKNLANAHGFINNVSDRTRTGMSMVVVDSDGAMNGVTLGDSNTIYIDASNIEDGTYLKTMVEEVAHFSEGTESYGKLISFIAEDEDLFSEVVGDLVAEENGYGFTKDTFLSLVEKSKAGDRNALTGEEKSLANEIGAHMVAETFGSEAFMQKVIKGEPTLAEKMIARIKSLKNALSGNESAEARAERKRLEKAEKLWMKSVEDAGYKYAKGKLIKRRREKEEEEKEKATSSTENVQEAEEESSEEGEVQTEDFDDLQTRAHVNDAQFSLKFAPQIAETQRKYIDDNNSAVTSVELDRAIEQTQKMVDIMSKHADLLPKDTVGKTLVKNGSYDVSVENTTVCIRTLAYNSFVDMVSEKIRRPLTQMESFLVSQKLYEIAREPQCLYCYVSLDRKAYNEMVIRYVEQRDAAISAWEKAGRPNVTASSQLYKDFLGTRKATDNMWLRYKSWIDMAKKGEKLLTLEDLSTEAKRSEMTLGTESQKSQVRDILKYAQSASWAKKQTQFVAYKDEILKLPQRTINALNKHYGLRWYSFSDYSGAFIVENMQQITDAAIRGLKGLAYTKDTDFVKIFAPTGMNINVSVYAMKDGKGGYVIDPKQSADIEEAIKLREKYPNVGIVVVATDNDGVKWALDQEWSDVVIPFHTVRTGADVAAFYDWEVFNAEQADSVEDKNLWEAYVNSVAHTDSAKKKVSKNIYPSEHQNDRETYFRILKERGLKARFSSFAYHPNYMKLVNETRQSEKDTRKLTPTFALDAAEASFDKFVEKGGYYEGWYNDGIDVDGEAEIVAEDVKAGKKPDEVDYALKNVDYEAMQKQRKKNRVHSGGAQFSLPNKGGEAKKKANRNRAKTYTRSDSEAIVDVMIGDAVFGYGEYVGTLKGKGNIVDALWVKLNSSDEKERKKYAFKLADAVIDSMVLNLAVDDPVMEVYTDRVEKLGAYVRRLDLTSIKDELNNTGNAQHYRSRWQRYDRKGMTPDQIVSELAENGIIIEADNPADILFEIDAMYTEALQGIKDNSNLILEQVLDKAELDAYRNDLARRFLEASNELGSASKLSREYYEEYLQLSAEYEHAVELLEKDMKKEIDANTEKTMKDIEKRKQQLEREREKFAGWRKKLRESDDEFRDKMRDKFRNQEKTAKLIREVVHRAQVLGSYKKGTAYSVSEYNDPTFWSNLESLSNILRAGSISVTKTRSICRDLAGWMGWIHDPNQYDGLTEEQKYDIQVIRTNLEDLSYGDKSFTVGELQTLSITLAQITNFVKSYGKIRRNGKLVEAKPYVENFIKIIEASNKIPRGLQRKFFESGFMGNFADPATLMRYADGYEEGFFTETFNEFREGAVTVAVTRMELMQEYDAFMKSHKKYADHLAETVEFRGQKMTRSTAIALWMTSKRSQAQLGLVKSGIKYRYEPTDKAGKKDANGVKVYDVPPLGDPTADYTQDEIDQFMKDLRADLEKTFTDADRQYIAMAENIFDECGEIKREVDLERKGVTNVADGYYFPIVRADKASSMDTESWREAVDRVNNLSMNKDTVKGAKSRLFIGSIDTILKSHVNQVSLYKGISTAVDNYNILVNLNVGSNKGAPISINERVQRTDFGKEALNYLKKLKEDIEQINRREIDDRGFTSRSQKLRGNYATYQLGANPKVWVTQLSSLVAANDILDADSIAKGMTIANKKLANGETEVDKYCPLAKQRNYDNVAYEAQSVSARVTNKVGEVLMKPVGKVDRFVVERLWGACQVQVEKDGGAKVGTVENKEAAGKLLQKVILETQQNALPTERSSAMRSTSEVKKTLTMFYADAMKIIGRVFDGFGRYYFSKQRLKVGNLTDEQRKHFEAEKKAGFKQFRKATAILLTQSVLMALVALGFKALLAQLDDEEPEEIAGEFAVDAVGNTLGGLPIFRDVYGFLWQGYELDSYLYSSFNDMMTSVKNVGDLTEKTINGEATSQDYAKSIRSAFYSAGQIFGLPTRNVYKYTTGIIKRVSPETGYAIDSAFTKPSIKADLKKAIEAGDTKMVARIAEVATSENYGMYSDSTRKSLRKLVEAGYTVFPRTVGDTVTVDGETYELSNAQKKQFEKVYAVSNKAVEELVSLRQYGSATDEVKAKALKYVYDTYYSVALDDLMGTDTEQKSVLFAEVIDVELLAMIVAHVSTLAADKDKDGKMVNGSRKNKIVAYVNSLNLSAAEKYMIMGYLGYKNTNGKNQVESLINRSSLSRTEEATLLAYSGY